MPPGERLIDDLADAILDGSPIDWAAAESSSDGTAQLLVGQLRVLAAVADLHRGTRRVHRRSLRSRRPAWSRRVRTRR